MFQSLFEKWVERATRLLRSATRRPERRNATLQKGRPHWLEPLLPFRPASRRTAQAGRLCYRTTGFQTRSQSASEKWVVRATRPPRSATRRPERRQGYLKEGRFHWLEPLHPFRPA